VDKARNGGGPSFLELRLAVITLRLKELRTIVWKDCVTKKNLIHEKRDPIKLFKGRLLKEGLLRKQILSASTVKYLYKSLRQRNLPSKVHCQKYRRWIKPFTLINCKEYWIENYFIFVRRSMKLYWKRSKEIKRFSHG